MSDRPAAPGSVSASFGSSSYGATPMGFAPAAKPAATAPANGLPEVTAQTFSAAVLTDSMKRPVLVDFWAPWCGPCKQLTPILEKVAKAAGDKVKIVKMNIDEHPAVAGQLGIQSIPAVIAFSRGQPVDGFMGALPEGQVRAFVERLTGPLGAGSLDEVLAEAKLAAEAGDIAGAGELYAAALAEEPGHPGATAGLARLQLDLGAPEAARGLLDTLPEAAAKDPAVAALRAALDLADKAAGLGEVAELRAKADANPDDHQARYDLALALAAADEREEAADALLAIVRADRTWDDDGARRELVKLFEAWGPKDPATQAGRRKLSSLLFS